MKKYLTEDQKNFIKQNYQTMENSKIIKILGITYNQLHSYASNNKLKKQESKKKTKPHYFEVCLNNRKAQDYNIENYLGHEFEPKIDQSNLYKSKYGKYYVNQDYFQTIDNEWKAYWLGFLYADGYVIFDEKSSKKKVLLGIGLSIVDKDHLNKLKDSLQTDAPIKEFATNYKNCVSAKLTVCNLKMVQDLCKLGCVPNKTLILKFPDEKIISKNLLKHFIRGYFDGDGCISINIEKRTARINILGTYDFISELKKILIKEIGASDVNIISEKGTKIYYLQYGDIALIEKFYKYLYRDANIYLQRKLNKFDSLFSLA